MREIKFRGKGIETGEWHYGSLGQTFHPIPAESHGVIMPTEFAVVIEMVYDGTDSLELFYNFVDPETVGQYIGLNDKYNRMIYEGDILCGCPGAFVDYEEKSARFVINVLGNTNKIHFMDCLQEDLQIIGNVHEDSKGREEFQCVSI